MGAYYYNQAEDLGWYVTGAAKLQDAMAISRSECERLSKAKGQCILYSLIVPKGVSTENRKVSGVPRFVAKAYATKYRATAKKKGYSAFAINGLGGYGYSNGYDSAKDAAETAQLQCSLATTSDLLTFVSPARALIHKLGADLCKVIDQQHN